MQMKMRSMWTHGSIVALALTLVLGCSDDDGDGGGTPDAMPAEQADAMAAPGPDAMSTNTSKQLGEACTPDGANGPGDCGEGFTCLNLQGGSGAWCSKICTGPQDTVCADGYTGDGAPGCYFGVQDQSGNVINFCAIICEEVQPVNVCPNCPITCPVPLQCTAELSNQMGDVLAKACQ